MAKYRLLSSRNLYRTPLAGVVRAADAALVERRAVFATARLWSTLSSRWTYATTSFSCRRAEVLDVTPPV
jgi:hypothetical protein